MTTPTARRARGRTLRGAAIVTAATALCSLTGATAASAATESLGITMQAQEKTNWCWAASANTILDFLGHDYTQNEVCNAAFGRTQGTTCPNNQANLGNVQTALRWAEVEDGSYISNYLKASVIKTEIDNDRPIETRILWSSGGGHMHVVAGYETASNGTVDKVYWGDPWKSNQRYNWGTYTYYVGGSGSGNDKFSWTHTLYKIGQ